MHMCKCHYNGLATSCGFILTLAKISSLTKFHKIFIRYEQIKVNNGH